MCNSVAVLLQEACGWWRGFKLLALTDSPLIDGLVSKTVLFMLVFAGNVPNRAFENESLSKYIDTANFRVYTLYYKE